MHIYGPTLDHVTAQSHYLSTIEKDSGLSTLSHSCEFPCHHQGVLKTFTSTGYFNSEDGVVWLWKLLLNFHIYGLPFYAAITQYQYYMTIGMDSGLTILCDSFWFASQQRILKTFLGTGYLRFSDEVVWPWHFSVSLHKYGSQFSLVAAQSQCLLKTRRNSALSTVCHNYGFNCLQRVSETFPGPEYQR